jgi:hypothetical protein
MTPDNSNNVRLLTLSLRYDPPELPPFDEYAWDESVDCPGVRARLTIIEEDAHCDSSRFLDSIMSGWTRRDDLRAGKLRYIERVFREETLEDSEIAAKAWHETEESRIRKLLTLRHIRLAVRAETIERVCATHGEITRTI